MSVAKIIWADKSGGLCRQMMLSNIMRVGRSGGPGGKYAIQNTWIGKSDGPGLLLQISIQQLAIRYPVALRAEGDELENLRP
jgi:hypothetical protein